MTTKFKYPYKTTRPPELIAWDDQSWSNDASASCALKVPTKDHPKATLVLWAQADDKKEREFPEEPTFQLDWMPDSDEGWDDATCKTVLKTDSIAAVIEKANEFVKQGVR